MGNNRRRIAMLLILIIGCLLFIAYQFVGKSSNVVDDSEDVFNTYQTRYKVRSGKLQNTYETTGCVSMNEEDEAIQIVTINNFNANEYKCIASVGDVVEKGCELYSYKKLIYKANNTFLFIDERINENKLTLRFLDYSKLEIKTQVDYEVLSEINYTSKAYIVLNDKKIDAKIKYIDYIVNEGKVEISLISDITCLPGATLDVIFDTEINESAKYICKEALVQSGDIYYAKKINGESYEDVIVEIGKEFVYKEGSTSFDMIEIISGLEVGDIVVVEKKIGNEVDFKKEFLNE